MMLVSVGKKHNFYYQLREFVGITRTFGRESSMPQAERLMRLKSKLRHYPKGSE